MILKQFYLNCLAHASYVVADEESGAAAVVDPQRDVDQYLTFAADHNLRITHLFLTHFHADFIAGHLELRDRVRAIICLGRKAIAEYGFKPVGDGTVIDLGSVRIEALETPGHTVESISLLVYDGGLVANPESRIPARSRCLRATHCLSAMWDDRISARRSAGLQLSWAPCCTTRCIKSC